jgi:hypothetical protein
MTATPQHIAAELRRLSRKCEGWCNDPRAMMVQAAAVIEQMAEGLAAVTRERPGYAKKIEELIDERDALRAEVERLRAALSLYRFDKDMTGQYGAEAALQEPTP